MLEQIWGKKAFFIFSASNFAGSKSFYKTYDSPQDWTSITNMDVGWYEFIDKIERDVPKGNSFSLGYYSPFLSENNFLESLNF